MSSHAQIPADKLLAILTLAQKNIDADRDMQLDKHFSLIYNKKKNRPRLWSQPPTREAVEQRIRNTDYGVYIPEYRWIEIMHHNRCQTLNKLFSLARVGDPVYVSTDDAWVLNWGTDE